MSEHPKRRSELNCTAVAAAGILRPLAQLPQPRPRRRAPEPAPAWSPAMRPLRASRPKNVAALGLGQQPAGDKAEPPAGGESSQASRKHWGCELLILAQGTGGAGRRKQGRTAQETQKNRQNAESRGEHAPAFSCSAVRWAAIAPQVSARGETAELGRLAVCRPHCACHSARGARVSARCSHSPTHSLAASNRRPRPLGPFPAVPPGWLMETRPGSRPGAWCLAALAHTRASSSSKGQGRRKWGGGQRERPTAARSPGCPLPANGARSECAVAPEIARSEGVEGRSAEGWFASKGTTKRQHCVRMYGHDIFPIHHSSVLTPRLPSSAKPQRSH